jgi:GNAT superfamily N-acetyltransferase
MLGRSCRAVHSRSSRRRTRRNTGSASGTQEHQLLQRSLRYRFRVRIEEAIEVFGRAFTFTRSFTHPYVLERVGPLWVMRDGPRKKPEYRNEEWLSYGVPPGEADAIIQANRRERYSLCTFRTMDEPDGPLREGWKSVGYRLHTTEMFFVHPLECVRPVTCAYPIERVSDQSTARRLATAAGTRQILPEHLAESPPRVRQYVALDSHEIVGWVRSILCGDAAWCSNMYVKPTHRRRGVGKALMSRMLADDKAAGLTASVLLASHVGAKLYPEVGYDPIGQLFSYKKVRR